MGTVLFMLIEPRNGVNLIIYKAIYLLSMVMCIIKRIKGLHFVLFILKILRQIFKLNLETRNFQIGNFSLNLGFSEFKKIGFVVLGLF